MKKFSLLMPPKIIFGYGAVSAFSEAALPGKRAVIVTGKASSKKNGSLKKIKSILKKRKIKCFVFNGAEPEVSVETVDKCAAFARFKKADVFIGLGGGSALDCAKAACGIFREKRSVKDFLDSRAKIKKEPGYLVAIPTTAGTGSEVTKNAVLTYTEKRIKISLRGEKLVPALVVADPDLTLSMPKKVTAMSGMDALSHAIESYFSKGANDFTKALSLEAIKLITGNLYTAYKKPRNREARYNVLLGSLTAGLAFANGGLGAVHGIGHPAGAILKIPHGLVNAVLMPHVIRFNLSRCKKELKALNKAVNGDIIKIILLLNRKMKIPAKLGKIRKNAKLKTDDIVGTTAYTGSMSYNPVKMDEAKVYKILKAAL